MDEACSAQRWGINTHNILIGKPKGNSHSEDLGIDGGQ
jgi:hypothetical protein